MKNCLFIATLSILLFNSCSKDLPIPEPQTIYPNYTPMTVGSYWIYDWYNVDSNGNSVQIPGLTDSVYIAGDTIVGTDTFAVRVGTWYGTWPLREYWRDSAGYLVNPWGGISFSATNFTDTLYISYVNTQMKKYRIMMDVGEIVTVPVGTFRTLNAAYVYEKIIGTWPSVCWPIYDIHDFQYAENVGMVRTSLQWLGNPACIVEEGRLRAYYIAP